MCCSGILCWYWKVIVLYKLLEWMFWFMFYVLMDNFLFLIWYRKFLVNILLVFVMLLFLFFWWSRMVVCGLVVGVCCCIIMFCWVVLKILCLKFGLLLKILLFIGRFFVISLVWFGWFWILVLYGLCR